MPRRLGLLAIMGLVAGCGLLGSSNAPAMLHVDSTTYRYSIDLPAGWIVLRADASTSLDAQVAAAETAYPAMTTFIEHQKRAWSGIAALLAFDPTAHDRGTTFQTVLQDWPVSTPSDVQAVTSDYAKTLQASGFSVRSAEVVQLPGGTAARLRYSGANADGVQLAWTVYFLVGDTHWMQLTFAVSPGDVDDFEPLYDDIVQSWRLT
jgi:hypothetical protein